MYSNTDVFGKFWLIANVVVNWKMANSQMQANENGEDQRGYEDNHLHEKITWFWLVKSSAITL